MTIKFERVMCIEDDADIRTILNFSLGSLGGFSMSLCSSGYEALEQVDSFRPQLVLLDVMMPKMSGPETLIKLRAMPVMQGVPIVFLTASALHGEVEALLACGSTGIIVKPFDAVTLPQNIRFYWDHCVGNGSEA